MGDGLEEIGDKIDAGISVIVVAPPGAAHGFTNTGDGRLVQVDIHESPRSQTEWLEPRDEA